MFNSLTILLIVVGQVIFINALALEGKQPNSLIPKAPHCGAQLAYRVIGGHRTSLEEYPWLALLMYLKDDEIHHACGGSLINNRYVLTAAHCVTGPDLRREGILVSVRLGEHNTTSAEDCVIENNVPYCNAPPQEISIESVIFHEKYNRRRKIHDIALIRLSREVEIKDTVKPICLPNSKTPESAVGAKLIIAGWGETEHGNKSDVKLQVEVPLVSDRDCSNKSIFKGRQLFYDGQFCAGGVQGEDACYGDSGGPSMEPVRGFWYARGIVSYGNKCGEKDSPAVYTRISYYIDWIHKNVLP